ncbi:MAG: DUF3833 domain-containing protein [Polaromonas sp.]|nr:DUF3833 domain-containing protein [Polaromonas sp.]
MKASTRRLAGGLAILAISAALLTGCAAPQVTDYAGEKPTLDLRQYFNGTIDAYGVFTDRSGKVARRFTVVMTCSWQGPPGNETGTLDEEFTYSDGAKERRVWTLKRTGEGRYVGTAADVTGEANGQESGNAFRWGYTLKLPVDGKIVEVQFDDWMYLMNEKVLLNKAEMSKFGFRLGEVTLSFVKR